MDDAVFTLFIHCSHHSKSSLISCVYSKQTGKEKAATLPEQQRIFLEMFLCGLLPLAWTEILWIFFGPILGCDWIPGGEERRREERTKWRRGWRVGRRGGRTKQWVAMVMKGLLLHWKGAHTHAHTDTHLPPLTTVNRPIYAHLLSKQNDTWEHGPRAQILRLHFTDMQ